MLQWFNSLKIQRKLFLTFFPLFFISLLTTAVLYYDAAEQNILKKTSEANINVLHQVSDKIEMINSNVKSISNMYYLDSNIRRLLKSDWSKRPYEENVAFKQVKSVWDEVNNTFGYLNHSTTLLGFNNNYYQNNGAGSLEEDMARRDLWLGEFAKDPNKMILVDTYEHGQQHILSAVSYLRDIYSGEPLGLLILDFEEDILFNTYQSLQNMDIMLVNAEGKVISSRNKTMLTGSVRQEAFFDKLSGYQSGHFIANYDGRDMLVSFYKVPQWDWYVVDLHPLSSLLEGMHSIKKYMFWIALAASLVLLALCYALSYAFSSPIKRLVRSTNLVGSGHLKPIADMPRKDEIGVLVTRYNAMLERINSLMQEILVQHEMKRKAELQGLQAQINPHFLYNTLSSIRWMVRTKPPEVTDQLVISLVRLLRQTFHVSSEFITFQEELAFITDYIYIQKIRYGGKFKISYQFDEAILECRTLRLLLQPVLENAIFHGIEPKEGAGEIIVKVYAVDEDVMMEVIDDGVGMAGSSYPDSAERSEEAGGERGNGMGIENIVQRIRLHFGESYGINIESEENRGTRVAMKIPRITGNRHGRLDEVI